MNYQTIEFLKCLSKRVACGTQLFERLRSEMLTDGRSRFVIQMQKKTCFLSMRGKRHIKAIQDWFDSVADMSTMTQAEVLFKQEKDLALEGEDLHLETQTALHCPGWLDPDKLHIVYGDEIDDALSHVQMAIRLELYRIVLAGGGRINKLPSLTPVHPYLQDYYEYYAKHIVPALKVVHQSSRFGYWAYTQRQDSRLGKLGKLSVFVAKEPAPSRHRLLPGEYHRQGGGGSVTWQGRGTLTNITPNNILQAHDAGIISHITADQLGHGNGADDPCNVLNKAFPNQWYAISADEYFAQLTVSMIYRTVKDRHNQRVCLYCGTASSNAGLCSNCLAKVIRDL